jgi:hypothetical protein
MESQYVEEIDSYLDTNRMITEGLCGGYIVRPYKVTQMELLEEDNEFIKRDV